MGVDVKAGQEKINDKDIEGQHVQESVGKQVTGDVCMPVFPRRLSGTSSGWIPGETSKFQCMRESSLSLTTCV